MIELGYSPLIHNFGYVFIVPINYNLKSYFGVGNVNHQRYYYFPMRGKISILKLRKNLIIRAVGGIGYAQVVKTNLLTGNYNSSVSSVSDKDGNLITSVRSSSTPTFQKESFVIAEIGGDFFWQFSKRLGLTLNIKQLMGLSGKIKQSDIEITRSDSPDIYKAQVTSYSDSFSIGLKLNYNFQFRKQYSYLDK